jgi:hypothetical protein
MGKRNTTMGDIKSEQQYQRYQGIGTEYLSADTVAAGHSTLQIGIRHFRVASPESTGGIYEIVA